MLFDLKNFGDSEYDINQPKIISLLSGKGGVGKTVLAYNLALEVASLKKRVLLVDADFFFGNLHILANANPLYGINDLYAIDFPLKKSVVRLNDNLDLLASVGELTYDPNNEKEAKKIFRNIIVQANKYDYVIIDHCSGISKSAQIFAAESNMNIIILIPELTSLSDGYGLIKYIQENKYKNECCFIVNRCQDFNEANYVHQKFCALTESFIGRYPQYLGHIPDSDIFRQSVAQQKPVSELDFDCDVIQQLRAVAEILSGIKPINTLGRRTHTELLINNNLKMADIKE